MIKNIIKLFLILGLNISIFAVCTTSIDGGNNILEGFKVKVTKLTSSTILTNEYNGEVIEVESGSNLTISLPNPISKGYNIIITKLGDGDVIISANGNILNSIKGIGDITITQKYGSVTIYGSSSGVAVAFGALE